MATENLSHYSKEQVPSGNGMKIGLVVSEWNAAITNNLMEGARSTLIEHGVAPADVIVYPAPGSFELPLVAQWLLEAGIDGAIAIGSVIQGETRHFEFVCQAVAQGVKDVSLSTGKPVIFCVLTDDTHEQALSRSGGKLGNKGVEAAIAAIKMIALKKNLSA